MRTAARNAVYLGLSDRARFFVGDWATAVSGRFDAILANPPYIESEDARPIASGGRLPRSMAGSRWWRGSVCGRTGR